MKRARKALGDVELPQSVWQKDWVVFTKRCARGSSQRLLRYLGRYIHRTALTDKRIIAFDDDSVTFRYRDSRDSKHKTMTLAAAEFIRRFVQHVPPKGMHRVRSYGLLHPHHRPLLQRVQLFAAPSAAAGEEHRTSRPRTSLYCPHCGAVGLQLLLPLSAQQCASTLRARSPPGQGPSCIVSLIPVSP